MLNVFLVGTRCAGKTTLLRHIVHIFGAESLFSTVKQARRLVVHGLVSSIYNVCAEHAFFRGLRLSERVRNGVAYFEQNRLSRFDAPFLTKVVTQHIAGIFGETESHEEKSDDHFVRLVFEKHAQYRNMYALYADAERYCGRQWLAIWDSHTLPSSPPIAWHDVSLDGARFRFWDISARALGPRSANFSALQRHVAAHWLVFVTAPSFAYEIEGEHGRRTAMRASMACFERSVVQQARWASTPLLVLLNKCDAFKADIENGDASKTMLLSFGIHTFADLCKFVERVFASFRVSRKRPFHVYRTSGIREDSVMTVVHHVATVTNLYTNNKRLQRQINANATQMAR